MAHMYLFFRPAKLPLDTLEIDARTVLNLEGSGDLRASLEEAFPGMAWDEAGHGHASVDGNWYEVHLPLTADETVVMRCSLRVDHAALVQGLCDRLGWLAFDERSMCFQPHAEPVPA